MPGKHIEPREPGRRWWEIRGKGQPDEGSYRELLTDSRGRSRQERSLSAGADPSDEPPHPLRGFLWPIASLVAAALLIVVVIYGVSPGKPRSPTPAERAAGSSANSDAEITPSLPSALVGNPPLPDGAAPPPVGGLAAIPNPPAPAPPRLPATTPNAPVTTPSASSTTRDDRGNGRNGSPTTSSDPTTTSNSPTTSSEPTTDSSTPSRTPTSSTPTSSPASAVTLAGPAPAAPGSQQGGTPVSGTGGCAAVVTSVFYACTIAQTAPVYLPGTTNPRASLRPNRYPFLCQADGSQYSVGQRANHWWAWAGNGSIGVWTPAVFLAGGPDDGPEPGLPVCGSAPTTTTSPVATSTGSAPTTTTPLAATPASTPTTTTPPAVTSTEAGTTHPTPPETPTGDTAADDQPSDEPPGVTSTR